MTFEDDYLTIVVAEGEVVNARLIDNNMSWPPPEMLKYEGVAYVRESYSTITDEQRGKFTSVVRGALYKPHPDQSMMP